MKKRQKDALVKLCAVGALLFIAASGLSADTGRIPTTINTYMVENFGGGRAVISMLISWIALMVVDERMRRKCHIWLYVLAVYLFTSASLHVLRGIEGDVPRTIAVAISSEIGVGGLVGLTIVILTIPFYRLVVQMFQLVVDMLSAFNPVQCVEGIQNVQWFEKLQNTELNLFVDSDTTNAKPCPMLVSTSSHTAPFSQLLKDKQFMADNDSLPIGVARETKRLLHESLNDSPHWLVAGKTGSGKTCFLQTVVVALAMKNSPDDVQFILIDGVRRGLKPLVCLPHAIYDDVVSTDADVIEALKDAVNMLNERIQNDTRHPRIIIVIDEIDRFYINRKKAIDPLITEIVKSGRQFNINIIVGSQRPSADLISPHVLSMMSRVCLKVELPRYSNNIIDSEEGARLESNGDLLYYHDGQLTRAQGLYLSPEEMSKIMAQFTTSKVHIQEPTKRTDEEPFDLFQPGRQQSQPCTQKSFEPAEKPFELFQPRRMTHEQVVPFHMNIQNILPQRNPEYSLNNREYSTIQPETQGVAENIQPEYSEVEQIKQLAASGMVMQKIADTLDLPYSRVQRTLKKIRSAGG